MTSSTEPKVIVLRGKPQISEAIAAVGSNVKPGYLIEVTSTNTVRAEQSASLDKLPATFAIEAGYLGGDIDDVYADGQTVSYAHCQSGDRVYAWLDDNIAITAGAFLQSAGNGALKADGTGMAIARALETVTTVGGAVAFGRIRVEIL